MGGPIKSHNFSEDPDHVFEVKVKAGAAVDSNAYTSEWLPMHNDLAPRENVPGLQILMCLENTCPVGGETSLADGFAIAQRMRQEDPELFKVLTTTETEWVNKAKTSEYRQSRPMLPKDPEEPVSHSNEIRWTTWLRNPIQGASLEEMDLMYRAQRRACQM